MFNKYEHVDISELIGKTMSYVEKTNSLDFSNNEAIIFTVEDGQKYAMTHFQDCCESVWVEDIDNDLSVLVGSPILVANETYRDGEEEKDLSGPYNEGSSTWTFYKLATLKGWVTIRWYGTSNGYYSETAHLVKIK